ncbi:histone-lysine N-methyltransferase SETMAR [Trichonephila clavipes]|nr:histone-lysine N-methyltransferase SETMAR [Trichonephila clavipes]
MTTPDRTPPIEPQPSSKDLDGKWCLTQNLAPSDFHLFPELKKNLGGTQFQTDEEVQNAVVNFLHGQAAEFYHSGLKKWVPRMQKCIQRNGDYVEK